MDPARTHLQSDEHMETRISQFLGEFRIMVPGLAAMLGFQLTAAWSSGWDSMPATHKALNYVAVLCTMLALVFILVPGLYHRAMREIEENHRFLRFAARYFGLGIAFFAVSLVITVYLQGYRVFESRTPSLLGAGFMAIMLLFLWLAIPQRRAKRVLRDGGEDSAAKQHRLPVMPTDRGRAGRQV